MTLHHGFPDELSGHDLQAEMPATVFGSFMPAMQMSFINDFKGLRLQGQVQPLSDLLYALFSIHCGMTRVKGETSIFS